MRLVGYDACGQATNIIEKLTNGYPIAFFKLNWDAAARVQWEFAAPLPHTNTAPPTRTMTYNADNQIATFNGVGVGYDLDGNLTNGPVTNATFAAYTYNARNQLAGVGGLTYAYDAAGNRIAMTNGGVATKFVVNPNAKLPQVLIRTRGNVTNYYVYGQGLLYEVTETASSTNTLTCHFDYRGSTVAITDGSGNVTDRIEYSSYGLITVRGGTNDVPFLYNGRYGVMTDPNGLYYMRARYYNPYLCRFLNPDPSGFAGGLNWYCFADGNPISMMDPFGLGAVGEEGWGGATATWINKNVINPLNSVSTTSTTVNFASYMAASTLGGLGDLLRVGQGTADATYNARDGYDVAIGITQDIARAAGIATILGGGLEGAVRDMGSAAGGTGPLLSTTGEGSMDSALFQRIQTAFQRNGGVMQADAESTRLLNSLGAEGATLDSQTILLRQNPSTSAVYEELIHSSQLRAGMTDTVQMEIQAAQKLIRFSKQYNIPASETQQTINRLNALLQQ